jgi:hypothetical protein
MFDADADLDRAERWVDDWQAKVEEQAARARELSNRVTGLTATASSSDGLVEVTVSSAGAPTGLYLDEATRRRPAADTAAQILATMRSAQKSLAERVAAVVDETVGRESAAGKAVIDSYVRG